MPEVVGGLERFAAEVAAILDVDPAGVSTESRLVDDLAFDSLAFVELAILLMERYSSQNFMTAIAEDTDINELTVRSVFENYAR